MGQNSPSQEGGAAATGKPRTLRVVLLILVIIAFVACIWVWPKKKGATSPANKDAVKPVPELPRDRSEGAADYTGERPAGAPDLPGE